MSAKRARNCIKRQRPAWWGPAGVVERLQAGRFITDICADACRDMAEVGIEIAPVTLRAEVARWCESASWGEQLRAGLALWRKTSRGEMALSKHWHEDFFQAMEATGGKAKQAAEIVGIGYGIVLALTDRRNKCYDAEFHERFRIAEAERVGGLRERYYDLAETGEGKMAFRAQERIIEASLPGLHGQSQEMRVSGKIDHEHEHEHRHTHGLAPELAREVVAASQNRMRRINAGRQGQGLLPADPHGDEGQVIDVTPARQRQEVPA